MDETKVKEKIICRCFKNRVYYDLETKFIFSDETGSVVIGKMRNGLPSKVLFPHEQSQLDRYGWFFRPCLHPEVMRETEKILIKHEGQEELECSSEEEEEIGLEEKSD